MSSFQSTYSFMENLLRKKFEVRREFIENSDFINRFREELNKFGEIKGLTINADINEEMNETFAISLDRDIPDKYSQSYNELLLLDVERAWELILDGDTMESLNDCLKITGEEANPLNLFLINNSRGSFEGEECFGIEVRSKD